MVLKASRTWTATCADLDQSRIPGVDSSRWFRYTHHLSSSLPVAAVSASLVSASARRAPSLSVCASCKPDAATMSVVVCCASCLANKSKPAVEPHDSGLHACMHLYDGRKDNNSIRSTKAASCGSGQSQGSPAAGQAAEWHPAAGAAARSPPHDSFRAFHNATAAPPQPHPAALQPCRAPCVNRHQSFSQTNLHFRFQIVFSHLHHWYRIRTVSHSPQARFCCGSRRRLQHCNAVGLLHAPLLRLVAIQFSQSSVFGLVMRCSMLVTGHKLW